MRRGYVCHCVSEQVQIRTALWVSRDTSGVETSRTTPGSDSLNLYPTYSAVPSSPSSHMKLLKLISWDAGCPSSNILVGPFQMTSTPTWRTSRTSGSRFAKTNKSQSDDGDEVPFTCDPMSQISRTDVSAASSLIAFWTRSGKCVVALAAADRGALLSRRIM